MSLIFPSPAVPSPCVSSQRGVSRLLLPLAILMQAPPGILGKRQAAPEKKKVKKPEMTTE